MKKTYFIILLALILSRMAAGASVVKLDIPAPTVPLGQVSSPEQLEIVEVEPTLLSPLKHSWVTPYALPYSTHCTGGQNWHRMWINTAVLSGAFVSTLFVLELLPEDATSWNRAEIQKVPMFKRWYRNIFIRDPEWDHDKFYFNYLLHPYAGAVYYMSARSCGFSIWGSFLYSFAISTVGWEFGIEAFMERPSYQDIVITPVVGSLMGELCYRGKRAIVDRGYELLGSSFLGHAACFILDPVNEVIDLFRGNPAREVAKRRKISGSFGFTANSLALTINF